MDFNKRDVLTNLGFCGCGDPEGVLKWVLEGVDRSIGFPPDHLAWEEKRMWVDTKLHLCDEFFGGHDAYMFFLYWLDDKGLTEHGSSVCGSWLTQYGEEMTNELIPMAIEKLEKGEYNEWIIS